MGHRIRSVVFVLALSRMLAVRTMQMKMALWPYPVSNRDVRPTVFFREPERQRLPVERIAAIRGGGENTHQTFSESPSQSKKDVDRQEKPEGEFTSVGVDGNPCEMERLVMISPLHKEEPWAVLHAGLLGRIVEQSSSSILVKFVHPLDPHSDIGRDQLSEGVFDLSKSSNRTLVYFEHTSSGFVALAQAAELHLGHLAAKPLYEHALDLDAGCAFALFKLGDIAFQSTGDARKAERLLSAALELQPCNLAFMTSYAVVLASESMRQYARAETLFTQVLKQDPKRIRALCGYALMLQEASGNAAGAEFLFNAALSIDPEHPDTLCSYATFLGKANKDYTRAAELYKMALIRDPTHMLSLCNYGLLLHAVKNDVNAARLMFDRAIAVSPTYAPALCFRGVLLHSAFRDYQGAEDMYLRAVAASPSYSTASCNYGHYLTTVKHDYAAAESVYEKAILLEPCDTMLLCNYANMIEQQGHNHGRASDFFLQALAVDPDNLVALSNYAHVVASIDRDLDLAEVLLRKALAADVNHEDARRGLSAVLRGKEALQHLRGKSATHAKAYQTLERRRKEKEAAKSRRVHDDDLQRRTQQAEEMAKMLMEEEAQRKSIAGKGGGKASRCRPKRKVK